MSLSDAQYIQIIQKAARRLNRELSLTDTTDEISIDGTGEFISPDDDDLRDLVVLLSECMIAQRSVSYDSSSTGTGGVLVKDGEQTFDTRGKISAKFGFLNSKYGPCAEYQKQIYLEKIKRTEGYDIW